MYLVVTNVINIFHHVVYDVVGKVYTKVDIASYIFLSSKDI